MSASILYIHGLNSSPASLKARQLSAALQRMGLADQLRVPELHHHPRQAIAQLHADIKALGGTPLLVGSSLGGYYATHLAERLGLKALLINPAVNPHKLFKGVLGPQTNFYNGQTWDLTLDHIEALKALEVPPPHSAERYQVWLQTGDETLDYRHAERFYDGCDLRIEVGGDHGFQGFAEHLPQLFAYAGIAAKAWEGIDFAAL
ncbi:MAG: YqiA/YcfP family alpha/beta fold hydrolase [Janthinobacterium lividum]|uniref:YqiA/YcfP family alpha/beta fold hydrolase n=1 Tax=Pseudomonas sp. MWU16-30317 TaxID=2878095 RepID=UPI001CF9AE39